MFLLRSLLSPAVSGQGALDHRLMNCSNAILKIFNFFKMVFWYYFVRRMGRLAICSSRHFFVEKPRSVWQTHVLYVEHNRTTKLVITIIIGPLSSRVGEHLAIPSDRMDRMANRLQGSRGHVPQRSPCGIRVSEPVHKIRITYLLGKGGPQSSWGCQA